MKKIFIALAATLMVGSAFAQPHGDRHRGRHFEPIPDRVERRVLRNDSEVRVVLIERYRCAQQRRDRCVNWDLVKRERRVVHKGDRDWR